MQPSKKIESKFLFQFKTGTLNKDWVSLPQIICEFMMRP